MATLEVPVLVVGGSARGVSSALLPGHHGSGVVISQQLYEPLLKARAVRPDGLGGWRSKAGAGSPSAMAGALARLTARGTIVS